MAWANRLIRRFLELDDFGTPFIDPDDRAGVSGGLRNTGL
jgi:hypothetical protein